MRKIVSSILTLGLLITQTAVNANTYSMEISGIVDPVEELILISGLVTSGPDERISVVASHESGEVVFADEVISLNEGKFKAAIDAEGLAEGNYTAVFRAKDTEEEQFNFSLPLKKDSAVKIDAEISGNDLFLIKDGMPDEEYSKITFKIKNAEFFKGILGEDDYTVTGIPEGYYVTANAVSEDTVQITLKGSGEITKEHDIGITFKSTVIGGGRANTSSDEIKGIVIYPEEFGNTVNLDDYELEAYMTDARNVNTSKSTFEVAVKLRGILKEGVLQKGTDYDFTLPSSLSGLKCELSANKKNGTIRIKFSGSLSNALTADAVISDFVIKADCVNGAKKDSEPIKITFKKASTSIQNGSGGSGSGGSGGGGMGMGYTGSNTQTVVIEPTVPKLQISFDDAKEHWASKEIHTLAADGVINGIGNNNFAPDRKITRAEFVTLIVRAFELSEGTYDESFSDVKKNDWYAGSIGKALTSGIISRDTVFRPNDPITREEMVKIIVGGWLLENERPEWINMAQFSDKALISDWASEYIDIAVTLGLVKGDNSGNFNPKKGTTRAEATTVIYRLLYLN